MSYRNSWLQSQTRTDPPSPLLTSRRPSGLNASENTRPLCPLSVKICWPDSTDQNRMFESAQPATSRLLSGLKRTQ